MRTPPAAAAAMVYAEQVRSKHPCTYDDFIKVFVTLLDTNLTGAAANGVFDRLRVLLAGDDELLFGLNVLLGEDTDIGLGEVSIHKHAEVDGDSFSSKQRGRSGKGTIREKAKVAIRVCPSSSEDKDKSFFVEGNSIKDISSQGQKIRTFHHVFNEETSTQTVYRDCVKDMIHSFVIEGVNGTVLAFGQTGTGKTYTLHGDIDGNVPGIFQLFSQDFFCILSQLEQDQEVEVFASYLELYNDDPNDLFVDTTATSQKVTIGKSSGRVCNLTRKRVRTSQELIDAVKAGQAKRAVASTSQNNQSSRSHAIVQLTMKRISQRATFNFVDLAGSETFDSHKTSVQQKRECKSINDSLLALSRVFIALRENQSCIPYNQNNLTSVLRTSLSEDGQLVAIFCISPSIKDAKVTKNALNAAEDAKLIKIIAKPNGKKGCDKSDVIQKLECELARAKDEIARYQSEEPNPDIMEFSIELTAAKEEIDHLNSRLKLKTSEAVQLHSQIAGLESDKLALENAASESLEKIKRVETQLQIANETKSSLESKLKSSHERLEALSKAIAEQKDACNTEHILAGKVETERLELEDKHRYEMDKVKGRCATLEKRIVELETHCKQLLQDGGSDAFDARKENDGTNTNVNVDTSVRATPRMALGTISNNSSTTLNDSISSKDDASQGNFGGDGEGNFGGDGEEFYSKKENEDYQNKYDGDKSRDDEDIDNGGTATEDSTNNESGRRQNPHRKVRKVIYLEDDEPEDEDNLNHNENDDAGSEFEIGDDEEESYSEKENEDYHNKNDDDKSRDDGDIDEDYEPEDTINSTEDEQSVSTHSSRANPNRQQPADSTREDDLLEDDQSKDDSNPLVNDIFKSAHAARKQVTRYFQQSQVDAENSLVQLGSEYHAAEDLEDEEMKVLLLDANGLSSVLQVLWDASEGKRPIADIEQVLSYFFQLSTSRKQVCDEAKSAQKKAIDEQFAFFDSDASLAATFKVCERKIKECGDGSGMEDSELAKAARQACERSLEVGREMTHKNWCDAAKLSEISRSFIYKLGLILASVRVLLVTPLKKIMRKLSGDMLALIRFRFRELNSTVDFDSLCLSSVLELVLPVMKGTAIVNANAINAETSTDGTDTSEMARKLAWSIVKVIEDYAPSKPNINCWALAEKTPPSQVFELGGVEDLTGFREEDRYLSRGNVSAGNMRRASTRSLLSLFHSGAIVEAVGLDESYIKPYFVGLVALAYSKFKEGKYFFYRDEEFHDSYEITNPSWLNVVIEIFERAVAATDEFREENVWVTLKADGNIPYSTMSSFFMSAKY